MSHLQLATARQLGLYSQAGDVFSSGIYSAAQLEKHPATPAQPGPPITS